MKKMVKVVSLACASAMLVSTTAFADGDAFKVGGIGPVTGGAAVYGQAVKNATELAVNEINALGGVQFEFQFEDDEHDAEKSVNAYNTLKDWGMQMLLGTVTSAPCIAVAAETAEDNMFQLTPSGSAVESVAVCRMHSVYASLTRTRVLHLRSTSERTSWLPRSQLSTTALMYIPAVSMRNLQRKLQTRVWRSYQQRRLLLTARQTSRVQLQKAKDAGAELVFLPIYYTEASLILTQANSMGFAPMFFGCDGLDGLLDGRWI